MVPNRNYGRAMKLETYLARTGTRREAFAASIGTNVPTVTRYITGSRRPHWDVMQRIVEATGGCVMPNDFLASEDEPRSRGRPRKGYAARERAA